MPFLRPITAPPQGALPANLVTKAGVILLTLLFVGLIFSVSLTGGGGPASGEPLTAGEPTVDEGVLRRFQSQVAQAGQQQELARLADERAAERQRIEDDALAALRQASVLANQEPLIFDPATAEPLHRDESSLRRRLRLEEIERRSASLRTPPVVLSFRDRDQAGGSSVDAVLAGLIEQTLRGDAAARGALELGDPTADLLLQSGIEQTANLLEALQEAPGVTGGAPGVYTPEAAQLDIPLPTVATTGASAARNDPYASPAKLVTVSDPDGWERVYEGSFVEAVLVTQLSGDFPSPAIAMVSVPFYSADRQRILIPRGARFVGTAQQVRLQDQERLAVAFHRLIFPEGNYLPLHFQSLNQIGEGALKDEVDRHYLSMFLAAGSVGILSGLTLAGANPYSGGIQGIRAGAGTGLGAASQQILSRFLNRLPTITIRAGHRLRIWFTSDALLPTPATSGATP